MPEKWTHLTSVPSETSRGTAYGIDVNEDGTLLRCRCASFIHSKEQPKTCKHIEYDGVGRALRNYIAQYNAKKNPKPSEFRVIGKVRESNYYGGRPSTTNYLSGAYSVEEVVVVTKREFQQANAIITEAWQYASPHSKLKELLDNLGRP